MSRPGTGPPLRLRRRPGRRPAPLPRRRDRSWPGRRRPAGTARAIGAAASGRLRAGAGAGADADARLRRRCWPVAATEANRDAETRQRLAAQADVARRPGTRPTGEETRAKGETRRREAEKTTAEARRKEADAHFHQAHERQPNAAAERRPGQGCRGRSRCGASCSRPCSTTTRTSSTSAATTPDLRREQADAQFDAGPDHLRASARATTPWPPTAAPATSTASCTRPIPRTWTCNAATSTASTTPASHEPDVEIDAGRLPGGAAAVRGVPLLPPGRRSACSTAWPTPWATSGPATSTAATSTSRAAAWSRASRSRRSCSTRRSFRDRLYPRSGDDLYQPRHALYALAGPDRRRPALLRPIARDLYEKLAQGVPEGGGAAGELAAGLNASASCYATTATRTRR